MTSRPVDIRSDLVNANFIPENSITTYTRYIRATRSFHSFAIKALMTLEQFPVTVGDKCRYMDALLINYLVVKFRRTHNSRHKLMAAFFLIKDPTNFDNGGSIMQNNDNLVEKITRDLCSFYMSDDGTNKE